MLGPSLEGTSAKILLKGLLLASSHLQHMSFSSLFLLLSLFLSPSDFLFFCLFFLFYAEVVLIVSNSRHVVHLLCNCAVLYTRPPWVVVLRSHKVRISHYGGQKYFSNVCMPLTYPLSVPFVLILFYLILFYLIFFNG